MHKSPKEQKLDALEKQFENLLIPCLKECAAGRWGLFGQNQGVEAERYLKWREADALRQAAAEIRAIRSEWGQPNQLVEKFLRYSISSGANVPGEPKLAAQFLVELEASGKRP